MRHALSEANVQKIIVSSPHKGVTFYGITAKGKIQAQEAAEEALKNGLFDENTLIYSSDFLRCQETARIVQKVIQSTHLVLTTKLHERFFGDYDGKGDEHYKIVNEMDVSSLESNDVNVETAASVIKRVTSLIVDLEEQYENETILLVSHGFPCAVIDGLFHHLPIRELRANTPLFQNAEIRQITFEKPKQ